jgi:hypothetical protein
LNIAADKLPYGTGSHTMGLADFTAAGRALVDDADAAAQRTTLGLATVASSGSASDLGSGTLAAARGGAGTINGILKANGSGVVSLAAAGTDYQLPGNFPSAAFASLPAAAGVSGYIYRVTDVGATPGILMISDGSRWKALNGRQRLATLGAAVTGLTNTESISLQVLLPAALLAVNDEIEVWETGAKSGATDTSTGRVRIGTAGTTGDADVNANAPLFAAAANRVGGGILSFKIASATTAQKLGAQVGSYSGNANVAEPAAVTISNVSNALYISFAHLSSSTNDTITIRAAHIDWITP